MFAYMKMVKMDVHLTLQAGRLESESLKVSHITISTHRFTVLTCSITNPNLGTTRPTILYNSITIHSSTENKEVLKDASDPQTKHKNRKLFSHMLSMLSYLISLINI